MNQVCGAVGTNIGRARAEFPQTAAAGLEKKEGEVLRALQSLVLCVNALSERVDSLGDRINTAMAQVPETKQEMQPTPNYSAPLALGIANQTNEIAALTHRLDSFICRLEI
jgi:hypothetical protein